MCIGASHGFVVHLGKLALDGLYKFGLLLAIGIGQEFLDGKPSCIVRNWFTSELNFGVRHEVTFPFPAHDDLRSPQPTSSPFASTYCPHDHVSVDPNIRKKIPLFSTPCHSSFRSRPFSSMQNRTSPVYKEEW